jgi:hypothetical protein
MSRMWQRTLWIAVCWLGIAQAARAEAPSSQRSFGSADEAAHALVTALREHNGADWRAILGPEADRVIDLRDPYPDQEPVAEFLALYDKKHAIDHRGAGRAELVVGPDDWPLPVPIIESNGRWTFDTNAGAQSIVDRRIGRNELSTIRTMLACVDAQHEYFRRREQTTGIGVYATRLVSTPGHQDGLYWPAAGAGTESPLGRLMDGGAEYADLPGELDGDKPIQYEGYYFRVLEAQGLNADGGAKSYIQSGHLTGGFALIAWPAEFDSSGIMSFIVGPDGVVYQKDLGLSTQRIAAAVKTFDPDLTWSRVDMTHE